MVNSRFSVAIHILSLIATVKDTGLLTSDYIAGSVNTNPVVIRRISSMLKKSGLIKSSPGVAGYALTTEPQHINLLTVYKAVQPQGNLFAIHEQPNPECPVGKRIESTLDDVFSNVQTAMENELKCRTLQDILQHLDIK
ncbi:Rrf2 family transcriptional regulator [Kurthia sibirica]|uniref:Rrf2 family transcriptional regulator n=1 Tax=Kurthia sibirica TaxID=202750 RepID=A0A2U3AKB2_9BACL|nr:Rrf2 family transcriptional regulator [Kurthia sibirica]PWI24941.1 Rrf2 family transcriptional regulator [Kurthia sibirica]GEK33148.1 putative HTH-type transcriptional regulator YwnA [Kurthia sibirica]